MRRTKMAKYRVWVPVYTEIYLSVDVDDPTEEETLDGIGLEDKIIDEASEQMPGSLCYQCSGFRSDWGRDEGEPDWDNVGYEPVDG
jgi:hypothetical protein